MWILTQIGFSQKMVHHHNGIAVKLVYTMSKIGGVLNGIRMVWLRK